MQFNPSILFNKKSQLHWRNHALEHFIAAAVVLMWRFPVSFNSWELMLFPKLQVFIPILCFVNLFLLVWFLVLITCLLSCRELQAVVHRSAWLRLQRIHLPSCHPRLHVPGKKDLVPGAGCEMSTQVEINHGWCNNSIANLVGYDLINDVLQHTWVSKKRVAHWTRSAQVFQIWAFSMSLHILHHFVRRCCFASVNYNSGSCSKSCYATHIVIH